ncbi:hypothetical protein [Acidianus ambivalens]|uniref:Uncharacterized protein n=1 Tax=Acidianus ambivalens TaxID=2283 RepID=A0A650CTT2_ACIAM|nr:hypothetical protein [Acidianus ambivalens]MQL56233.1 hypothetical protein [Acidianus ambivalens]QGR21229.1 hypothetical protein D1866_03845 [Acidianus ambivalens]
MFRTLKRLIGIWEPREGVVYKSKDAGYERKFQSCVKIITECFIDGSWQECSFILKKGKYYVFVPKFKKQFVIEKKYVKVKKTKRVTGWSEAMLSDGTLGDAKNLEIRYRLMVKDPSKMTLD